MFLFSSASSFPLADCALLDWSVDSFWWIVNPHSFSTFLYFPQNIFEVITWLCCCVYSCVSVAVVHSITTMQDCALIDWSVDSFWWIVNPHSFSTFPNFPQNIFWSNYLVMLLCVFVRVCCSCSCNASSEEHT